MTCYWAFCLVGEVVKPIHDVAAGVVVTARAPRVVHGWSRDVGQVSLQSLVDAAGMCQVRRLRRPWQVPASANGGKATGTVSAVYLIDVSVTPTAADQLGAYWVCSGRLGRLRIALGVAVLLMGLVEISMGTPFSQALGFFCLLCGGGALVLIVPRVLVRRAPASAFVTRRYQIGREGLRQSTDTTVREWKWAAFRTVERTGEFWVLRGGPFEAVVVLIGRALSEEQDQQLAAILTEHGLLGSTGLDSTRAMSDGPGTAQDRGTDIG
jgi:hypothetical protein